MPAMATLPQTLRHHVFLTAGVCLNRVAGPGDAAAAMAALAVADGGASGGSHVSVPAALCTL